MNTNEVLQTGVSGMLTLVMAKFMLNDVPHAVLRSPGNPTGSETSDIIARTGMKEFEYKWFPEPEEERPGRVYPYTRTKQIGSYEIRMTRTDSTCTIRLYEFLSGWRKKLRATWTGMEKAVCEAKFEKVASTIRQVRFEHKTQMMR